ncbi:hypothetical protein KK090_15165 [Curtobacterium flaccumfaciens pv. poinsettiae]|nr:hypothetical protein [Curtobacterium flaccumfaciens]MBT1620600.1 hypothetical protein [Curtobacterium flaccumfaciens pv. poinsettiae]
MITRARTITTRRLLAIVVFASISTLTGLVAAPAHALDQNAVTRARSGSVLEPGASNYRPMGEDQADGTSHAWSYWYTFPIGHAKPSQIWNRLQTCFSCEIPVTGAPRQFPMVGDNVPFTLNRFGDDVARLDTVYNYTDPASQNGPNSGMIFTATEGNIGGAGSVLNIDFSVRATDGETVMIVAANVVNDFGSSGRRDAYSSFERQQWARVAANIQRNSSE